MPLYNYTARTLSGEPKSGTAEASDKPQLAHLLREQGLLLLDASRAGSEAHRTFLKYVERLTMFFGVPFTEKMLFARYLSVMIISGIDLPRALRTLSKQAQNKKFKNVLLQLAESVSQGIAFSDALRARPDVFSELFVSMVEVGEESGNLDDVLLMLAEQMEKDHALRSRLRGALIYPAIVVTVMVGVAIFMFILVVPKLAAVFRDVGVALPATTRFIIAIGEFLQHFWYLVPVFAAGGVVFTRFWLGTDMGKRSFAWFLLRMPIFSALVKKVASAQMARTLGSLVAAGVPIVRGLTITSNTVGNYFFSRSLARASAVVQKGTVIHEALARDAALWPPLVIELIAVGEETGKVGEVLGKLATFYESEVDQTTKNLSTVVEPVLMVVVGLAVGFFAVAMLQPMYSLVGSIQ